MKWIAADSRTGMVTGTTWGEYLNGGIPSVDPYLIVADLTDLQWFNRLSEVKSSKTKNGRPKYLPFLIESTEGASALQKQAREAGIYWRHFKLASVYRRSIWDGLRPSRFFTALIAPEKIDAFARLSQVIRMQLGMPRIGDLLKVDAAPIFNDQVFFTKTDEDMEHRSNPDPVIDDVVIGIIDDGCAFAHHSFLNAQGMSRVVKFWSQSKELGPNIPGTLGQPTLFGPPKYIGYGVEYDVQALMNKRATCTSDHRFYSVIGYDLLTCQSSTHGNGVMQLCAANEQPLAKNADLHNGLKNGDKAGISDIMFVQLDKNMLDDTAGGSLCVHALDGIRFIVDRAETYKRNPPVDRVKRRVAINLSYGTLGGPHDGSSPLERAIDELISERGNLAIVAAAGNSRQQQCHARLSIASNQPRKIGWFVAPDNSLPSSLEVWFPKDIDTSRIQLTVTTPQGERCNVSHGSVMLLERDSVQAVAGTQSGAVVFVKSAAQGEARAMALVFSGPTRFSRATKGQAPYGLWTIQLESTGTDNQTVDVDFWVERNDSAFTRRRRQQSYLVDIDGHPGVSMESTAANPSTASKVIAVGAYRLFDIAPTSYSSFGGPSGPWPYPSVYAPSEVSGAVRGLRIPGLMSGTSSRIGGTSAAAPVATRWLVNWITARPTFNFSHADIVDELANSRRDPAAIVRPTAGARLIDKDYRLL